MGSKNDSEKTKEIFSSEVQYFDEKAEHDHHEIIIGDDWIVEPSKYMKTLKMWDLVGSLEGKKVLECGCGPGFFSVLLAKKGAEVWGFDISPKTVELARERAEANGVADKVHLSVEAFETIKYQKDFFDLIVGKNILHHVVEMEAVSQSLYDILKDGGRAVFYELSARNPVLMFFRRDVIGKVKGIPKLGTEHEHPMTQDEVDTFIKVFKGKHKITHPKFRFFGKFDRQLFRQRIRPISLLCEGVDNMIYVLCPPLRPYSYKIMIDVTK